MKIFVTGCAGLLGANYTRHLLKNGHHVVGIDDLSGGYKAFVPPNSSIPEPLVLEFPPVIKIPLELFFIVIAEELAGPE